MTTAADRIAYWGTRGEVDAAPWPDGRTWLLVRTPATTIVAAPLDGLEVYIESAALAGADRETVEGSAELALLEGLVAAADEVGGLDDYLDNYGYDALAVAVDERVAVPWRIDDATAGVLVAHGIGADDRIAGDVPVVPVLGLRAEDAELAIGVGEYVAERMLDELTSAPDPTVTSATRGPLVTDALRAECAEIVALIRANRTD